MPIADGEDLSLHIYQEQEVNEGLKNDLVDVAQLAFSAEGLPEESDVRDHITSRSTLVVARDEDRPIGFGAVERVDNLVVQHGVAVRPENQGERLGSFLFDLATMLEAEHGGETEEIPIGGRTQSPFYIRYIKARDGYPRKNTQTPENSETRSIYLPDTTTMEREHPDDI